MSSPPPPPLVSVESPYNAVYPWHLARNIQYAILANTHAASLGETTYVPHLCNTQVVTCGLKGYISDSLGDFILQRWNSQRKYWLGREETLRVTNLTRQRKVDKVVCYTDYGISSGMKGAIVAAEAAGVPVEYRKLPAELKKDIFGESFRSTAIPVSLYGGSMALQLYGLFRLLRRR